MIIIECAKCGRTITARSLEELTRKFQIHAKDAHEMLLTWRAARDIALDEMVTKGSVT